MNVVFLKLVSGIDYDSSKSDFKKKVLIFIKMNCIETHFIIFNYGVIAIQCLEN